MNNKETFQSPRYMDYDYDNECIFGFNADEEDNMIFSLATAKKQKLKPLHSLSEELIGDPWLRNKTKHLPQTQAHYYQRTPSPISPLPNRTNPYYNFNVSAYPSPLPLPLPIPFHEENDKFDTNATDKRMKLASSDPESTAKDTIVRTDENNGILYETHGTVVITQTYQWKFILHEQSEVIVGLIDADIVGKQEMNMYIDTSNEIIERTLFKSGKPKQGSVILVTYDVTNRQLLIKNITDESVDNGREMVAVNNINVKKRYKLTVLLKKPSTVTMF